MQEPSTITFILEGHDEIVGAVVSLTSTVKLHVVLLLWASVAVYVTVVNPSGNVSPGFAVLVRVTEPQLSVATGAVHVAVAVQLAAAVDT